MNYTFGYWDLFGSINGVTIFSESKDKTQLRHSVVKDVGVMDDDEVRAAEELLINWLSNKLKEQP